MPVLDGLRFYAALLVFGVHLFGSMATEWLGIAPPNLRVNSPDPVAAALAFLGAGHHGVDLFFLLSGFLMMRLALAAQANAGGFGHWAFWGRRIQRLYPAFLASLCVGALLRCTLYGWPFHWDDFALNLVFANALPGVNVVAYNFVSWSLGHEFAFYALLPGILLLARKVGAARATLLTLVLGLLLIPGPLMVFNYLLIGAWVGSWAPAHGLRVARALPQPLALLLYAGPALLQWGGLINPLVATALFVVSLSLLFVKVVFEPNALHHFLARPVFERLGRLSYSLYLWHTVCISLVLHQVIPLLGLQGWPATGALVQAVLALLMSMAVAALSYRWFERGYFERRGR